MSRHQATLVQLQPSGGSWPIKTRTLQRPQIRVPWRALPKGMRDIGSEELRQTNTMLAKIREVYERYGFEPLETPAFEYTDALGKFLPDQDRPNEGVFSGLRQEARDGAVALPAL